MFLMKNFAQQHVARIKCFKYNKIASLGIKNFKIKQI